MGEPTKQEWIEALQDAVYCLGTVESPWAHRQAERIQQWLDLNR